MSPAHIVSMSDQKISIIHARPEHAPGMADCHVIAFGGRFMTKMGLGWLCALYRFFIKHPEGISYVAVDDMGKVVGFAVGGEPDIRDRFLQFAMLRYPHILFWKFMTEALVRAVLIEELSRKLHLKRSTVSSEDIGTAKNLDKCGNLLSICVLPDFKGTGIADQLIETFQNACAAQGYKHLKLSVVSENLRAIAFYKKHRWYETVTSGESTKFALDINNNLSDSDK